jgi:hypothetical protein
VTEHEHERLAALLRDYMQAQDRLLDRVLSEFRAAQNEALHEIKDAMIEALREIKASLISPRDDSERRRLDS